jgi:hypothetical protein
MRSGGSGVKRDVVEAASKEKWAVILWLRRRCGCDVCPRERRRLPTNPNRAPTPAQPTTPTISNPTMARPPTPYAISTATPGVQNTLRSPAAAPSSHQIPNAAYSAPLSPRPLPTNMCQHSTPEAPEGRQFKAMDVPRNHDLVKL